MGNRAMLPVHAPTGSVMPSQGTVSVIMPCYNDGAFIEESITSVQNQTYPHIEIIVIDDGSDDPATIRTLQRLSSPRLRILRSHRLHPAGARNLGIGSASGKYILPLDADDVIMPSYVEKAVQVLESRPEVGIVYCKAEFFGAKTGPWKLPNYTLSQMLFSNIIFVTAMFRKVDWQAVGGFNELHFKNGLEDYDFWLSLIGHGLSVHQLPEVLFRYRVKPSSRTSRLEEDPHYIREIFDHIYDRHRNLYERHAYDHMRTLRHELLRQRRVNRRMKSFLRMLEKATSLPIVKPLVKKLLEK